MSRQPACNSQGTWLSLLYGSYYIVIRTLARLTGWIGSKQVVALKQIIHRNKLSFLFLKIDFNAAKGYLKTNYLEQLANVKKAMKLCMDKLCFISEYFFFL